MYTLKYICRDNYVNINSNTVNVYMFIFISLLLRNAQTNIVYINIKEKETHFIYEFVIYFLN